MSLGQDLTHEAIASLTAEILHRLGLPYSARLIEREFLSLRLELRDEHERLRATVLIPRTSDASRNAFRLDFTREVHKALHLCPLCASEASDRLYLGALQTKCRNCGEFVMPLELARELAAARALDETEVLKQAARVAAAVSLQPGLMTIDRETFESLAGG